jgi:hypothetical protein
MTKFEPVDSIALPWPISGLPYAILRPNVTGLWRPDSQVLYPFVFLGRRKSNGAHAIAFRIVFHFCEFQFFENGRNVHGKATSKSLLQTIPPADRIFWRPAPGFDRAFNSGLLFVRTSQEHPVSVFFQHCMKIVYAAEIVTQLG